jgi:glycosyltransferase involved in cell wall biosynthesis
MTAVLHAALMPFPSPQGTQGAVAAIMRALLTRGDDAKLFVHPHGDGTRTEIPLVRPMRVPFGTSLRSGPTLARAALDLVSLPAFARASRGKHVFAHNVEAATAARLIRADYVFVAHTLMARELPYYASRGADVLGPIGHGLDQLAAGAAQVLAAISPRLVSDLERTFEREAYYLPIPWAISEPAQVHARLAARAGLGLDAHTLVLGYTGNLDRYQGTQLLLPTLAHVAARTRAVLVVATESDGEAFLRDAARAGLAASVHMRPLATEADREAAHALFDVLVVPRACEGGVPIKLLDALARGVPVVAAREALAGLPCGAAVLGTRAEAPSLGAACLLAAPASSREALADAGHRYLEAHHGTSRFLAAHDDLRDRLAAARART